MTLTLLLDLDDTLLNTHVESFVPAYFQALARELAPSVAPEIIFRALISSMRQMSDNEDFSQTLKDVFDADFFSQIGASRDALEPVIEKFYEDVFPTLAGLTSQNPDAKPFVEWAFSQGFRVAVATDPLLPREATHQRLRWAGFEPGQFELVTTYDHFHFSKTHPAYFAEALGRMGWPDGPVLMVGNDLDRDILPAQRLGLRTYHVDAEPASRSGPDAAPRGKLSDLRRWLESADPASLTPSFKSTDSVLGILSATPAALNSLLRGLDDSDWAREPTVNDWAAIEVLCHLRDTEREIHHMQIKLFDGRNEPFIPRPDTGVWASGRDYLHENGSSALTEFNEARRKTLELLRGVAPNEWEHKARHAIFGPTNFLEVVGFMADHDRMHIQQIWSVLKKL
ncbi:MAG: DinB family protein [Chloroflexi bacterium]|nr:DinB family protein [Chloroflexota bacterium]